MDPDYPPEKISRSQCWNLVFLELSLLDGPNCPVDELHTVIADIVTTLVRSELPLSIPSRWLMDLFGVLERLALLKIDVHTFLKIVDSISWLDGEASRAVGP